MLMHPFSDSEHVSKHACASRADNFNASCTITN